VGILPAWVSEGGRDAHGPVAPLPSECPQKAISVLNGDAPPACCTTTRPAKSHSKKSPLLALVLSLLSLLPPLLVAGMPGREPGTANPILPGYYADPSIVQHEGNFFLYATIDPWGGNTLGCWESPDFKKWTYRVLNWPTRAACTSPKGGKAGVWAPSVVLGPDKRFHMFVSVGNEVWVGVADQPLGPWRDANGGKPLIPREFKPGFHMIDAEAFIDTDGTPWLYWGSGHGWKNGKCWAVKLNHEMSTFVGEVHDITPTNYFEGPIMVKRHGLYFLMYSQGNRIFSPCWRRWTVYPGPRLMTTPSRQPPVPLWWSIPMPAPVSCAWCSPQTRMGKPFRRSLNGLC